MAASVIPYTWNAAAGRFIAPSGQFVSLAEVRAALDRAIVTAGAHAAGIAKLLEDGSIGYLDFERLMKVVIKDTQIYATAVASGGYSNIDVDGLSELTNRLAEQFAYLEDWADSLNDDYKEQKERVESAAQLAARARLYAMSARRTFDTIYRRGQVKRGYVEERSVLHPAEHCDACLGEAAKGWVAIGVLIPIGQRTCLGNCKCTIDYR